MSARAVLLLSMWLLFSTNTWASSINSQQLSQQLDQCINSFFTAGKTANRDINISLSKKCPSVLSEISHPALTNLQPPLQDKTTLAQLQDARAVLKYLRTRPIAQPSYDYESLSGILSDTYIEKKKFTPEASLWERFLDWLREIFKPEDAEAPQWLIDFLESIRIPEGVATVILEVSLLILVTMAILIIFNELRAANIMAAWRHRQQKKRIQSFQMQSAIGGSALTLEQIGELHGRKQSSALLYYILVHLMNKGLLPEKYNLTNHELAEKTDNFPSEPNGLVAGFKRFMGLSDVNLYAKQEPAVEEQRQALTLAQQIKEQSESV